MADEQRIEESADTVFEQQVYAFGAQVSERERLTANHATNNRTAIEHLMETVTRLLEERKVMRERMDRAEERMRNTVRRNGGRAENDDAALRAEIEQLRTERDEAQTKVEQLETTTQTLEDQLRKAQNELELATNRNDVLYQEFEALDRRLQEPQMSTTPPTPNTSCINDVPPLSVTPEIVTKAKSTLGKERKLTRVRRSTRACVQKTRARRLGQVRRSTRASVQKTRLTKPTFSSTQSDGSAKYCDSCKQGFTSSRLAAHSQTVAHKNVLEFMASNDDIQIFKPGSGRGYKQKDGRLLNHPPREAIVVKEEPDETELQEDDVEY